MPTPVTATDSFASRIKNHCRFVDNTSLIRSVMTSGTPYTSSLDRRTPERRAYLRR